MPNYNHAGTIRASIERIFETTHDPHWELIVVDDGSTDGSLDILARMKGIKLIRQSHLGVARALNIGFAAAGRNDVVRIHSDVLIDTTDWLPLLVDTIETFPKAGVVGCKLVYPDDRIQSVGRNILTGFGWHALHRERLEYQPASAAGAKVWEVDSVAGAFAYYRRESLDALVGVDENYWPAWADDDDLCIGARFHGFKVYVQPGVQAVHLTRAWAPNSAVYFADQFKRVRALSWEIREKVHTIHAKYWKEKWGWDPAYPDLNEIRRLYGQTEICWQIAKPLRFEPGQWPPVVDICMVTWNNLATLRRCLSSLAQTDYPPDRIHVCITDNASTDGTTEYLRTLASAFPFQLQVATLPVNTGCPVGMNWAMNQGHSPIVARLDDDVVLPPDWLRKLVEAFRRRPYAGMVGPKIINDDEKRAIQCSDYCHFPGIFGHDDEIDCGQVDYLARTGHVRGCCNVYRRDALDRCGLLDIRYSPSQGDDPDHHLALIQVGYELIYDGHVAVMHKLTNGSIRSRAAISNQQGNQNKMYGKWGADIYEVVDKSLDLSREGRYLPDDGDTENFMARGPNPAEFPRRTKTSLDQAEEKLCSTAIHWLSHRDADPENVELIHDHLGLAASLRRDGHSRAALGVLHTALNLAPENLAVMAALVENYQELGDTVQAAKMLKIRNYLSHEQCKLAETQVVRGRNLVIDRYAEIGETIESIAKVNKPKLRVLMVNTYENRVPGGDMAGIKKTKEHLERMGLAVDISCCPRPDASGYDLVHLWNLWFPHQTLRQLKAIRLKQPDIPIVLTPIYWDSSESSWATRAVPRIFSEARNPAELEQSLKELASGELIDGGRKRSEHVEPNFAGYERYQTQILEMVDCLLPLSYAEVRLMNKTLGVIKPFAIMRTAAEAKIYQSAKKELFIEKYGVKDFVLTVGLVEARKNQLMLLYALRGTNLPVVVLGRNYDRNYLRLCRKFAPPGTLFIEYLSFEMLTSAYKAARVHALPSWMECAAAVNIEAALAGCALAVSNRSSEPEYFQEDACYCDPADINSIRNAVLEAYHQREVAPKRHARLREKCLRDYTWELSTEQVIRCYQEMLRRKQATPAAPVTVGEFHEYELANNVYAGHSQTRDLGSRPSVTIVIPTFDKIELTRQCLVTIQQYTAAGRCEVIVVDNASADATRELLEAEEAAGRLRVISNPENRGFAKACNQGAQAARGEYVLFLNNDTEVQPGWLDPLVSLANGDGSIAAVGSKLIFPDGTLQHAGVAVGEVVGRDPLLAVHAFYKAPADLPEANQRRVYQALTAACLLVRKSAFEAVGGFDEGFWNGYEDVDLCFRFQEQGWLMVYEPASVVIHHESQSGPARFEKVQENIRRLHQKWLGKAKLDVSVAADGTVSPAGTTRIRPYVPGTPGVLAASIIILSYNQLAHTRACLESIARHTPEPYELILVDNGSTDGTQDYLRGYAAQHERVLMVANRTNRGFAAGNNQGLAMATGRQVLFLNNDTVVTPGWLGNMLKVLQEHPQTGVVGPRSNRVLGKQQVEDVSYKSLDELPSFAAAWAEKHAGESRVANRVVGFCLLTRREVIEAVGGLDEQFGSGNFEDDDFCIRAHLAGFETRIADDAFVHHVGNATFTGADIDYAKAMQTNWGLFKSKWAIPPETPPFPGYLTPDVVPPGVALKVPLPELKLTHQLSADGRCWMDKLISAAAKAKAIILPPCALVGQLREAQQFFHQKKLPAAWGATRAALKHRPFHPEAYLLLAEIALAAQDSVAALACAQFARHIAPEFRPAKKFLKGKLHGQLKPEWLVLPEEIGKHKAESRNWLSVCLIVKNEERFLAQCLASIKGLAHQVVVVDTGSTDRTVEIAREHGAQVHSFAWCDDFSAARNAALEHVTGDWVLVLDADEELPPEQHAALRKLLHAPSVIAWRLPLQDVGREAEGCSYVPRLFRNAPGLFYVGRVHEQVFSSVEVRRQEWGLETRLGDAMLRHYGYTKELTLERDKVGRNLRLLEQAILELPGEANLLMNYGLELTRSGRREEGLAQYRAAFEAMAGLPPAQVVPETREVLLTQFGTQLMAAKRHAEIVQALASPLAKLGGGLTASLLFTLGLAQMELKQFAAAAEAFRQCLAKRDRPALTPVNLEIRKAGPRHCLALCLDQLGETDAAAEEFRLAIETEPQSRPVRYDYARFLAAHERQADALNLLFALASEKPTEAQVWLQGGQLALSRPESLEVAGDWTAEAMKHLPDDAAVVRQRAEALMLAGQCGAALPLWRRWPPAADHALAAALVLCETVAGENQYSPAAADEAAVSREFLKWYDKLVQFDAGPTLETLNAKIEAWGRMLPSAAAMLASALAEAAEAGRV